jgi:hypothetical protein
VNVLLMLLLAAVAVAFVVLAVDDTRWRRRRLPAVTQYSSPRPAPPLPCGEWHPQFHLIRARIARADHARYVYPQEL